MSDRLTVVVLLSPWGALLLWLKYSTVYTALQMEKLHGIYRFCAIFLPKWLFL